MRMVRYILLALAVGVPLAFSPALPDRPGIAWAAEDAKPIAKYTCPMHPHYIADEPGTCPICGMDLVPLAMEGEGAAAPDPGPNERAPVVIAPETIQNMGVRTARVEQAAFGREIRSFGIVSENIRAQTIVSSRVGGWIEDLSVTAVGDQVKKGDRLYRLFSPELVSAQQDYIAALTVRSGGRTGAVEQRLRSLGVQPGVIDIVRRNVKPIDQVPFYAEASGIVSALPVRVGSYVTPGGLIAEIQDYATVWLIASVAEKDLAFLTPNGPARVVLPNMPGSIFKSRIDYIYPTIDPTSRTGQVRLIIDNKEGNLRPGAYADVVFDVNTIERLSVPSEAVLRSRDGHHVIASLGGGRFQPKAVEIGITAEGRTEVRSGLAEGETIVVSGQFLLDSESALRESFRKLERIRQPLALLQLDASQLAMVDHLLDAALYVHEAEIDGFDVDPSYLQAARDIHAPLSQAFMDTRLEPVLNQADVAVAAIQEARTESARLSGLADLAAALEPWIIEGRPERYRAKELVLFRDQASGQVWIQIGQPPTNPYGSSGAEAVPYADTGAIATVPAAAPSGSGGHVH